MQTKKKWWESQGFLLAVVALIGSFWGMAEGDAKNIVSAVAGLVSAIAFVLQFFKTSKFKGWKEVLQNSNTWAYLVAIFGLFIPSADLLFPALKDVSDALLSKNLGAIISALFTLGVVLFNIIKSSGAKNAVRVIALLFFASQLSAQAIASPLVEATVTSVFDGDGFNVKFGKEARVTKVRLLCIDAPERRGYSLKAQPYGNAAGEYLREHVNGKSVLLDTAATKGHSRDMYGRLLAHAYTSDTVNIQFMMVEAGLAWAVRQNGLKEPRFNDVLEREMKAAKEEKRGLWASYITPAGKTARIFKPETWRKNYSVRKN